MKRRPMEGAEAPELFVRRPLWGCIGILKPGHCLQDVFAAGVPLSTANPVDGPRGGRVHLVAVELLTEPEVAGWAGEVARQSGQSLERTLPMFRGATSLAIDAESFERVLPVGGGLRC